MVNSIESRSPPSEIAAGAGKMTTRGPLTPELLVRAKGTADGSLLIGGGGRIWRVLRREVTAVAADAPSMPASGGGSWPYEDTTRCPGNLFENNTLRAEWLREVGIESVEIEFIEIDDPTACERPTGQAEPFASWAFPKCLKRRETPHER